MDLSLTTELDAVNSMLETIGESPVNTLEVSGLGDVSIAINTLRRTSREVQSRGWEFNTEVMMLSPDEDGYINIPAEALKADPVSRDYTYVQRGTKLYDKVNNTFVFTVAITLEVIWLLDFATLPEPARHYIAVKASRRFQNKVLGSQEVYAFTKEDERDALAELKRYEVNIGDYNMGTGSYTMASALMRSANFIRNV